MEQPGHALLANCLVFVRMLRQAGLPIGVEQAREFAEALTLIDLGSREQVYFAARGVLVHDRAHLQLFEILFARFWRRPLPSSVTAPKQMPRAPRHQPSERFTIVNYLAMKAGTNDPERDLAERAGTMSDDEVLQRKAFSTMTPEELAAIKRLIGQLDWRISARETRRRRPDRRGDQLHTRRILRDAARHMGSAVRAFWRSRTTRPRPIVLIADISGSMEKYARLLLQFFYSVSRSNAKVESFVFGTRLTRITPALQVRNIDRAVDEAARQVADWSGGTRIGASLDEFNRRWGRRVLGRGAIVLLISDGWEQGDPRLVQRAMRQLQRRCYRLIWLNPLLGEARYQPAVAGMHAALPFIDDFLPIHNFQSLSALAERIANLPAQRSRA